MRAWAAKTSLLLPLVLLLASCEVSVYGGDAVSEEDFVDVLTYQEDGYLPSTGSIVFPSNVAAASPDPATTVSLFPFSNMGRETARSVTFYVNDGFSIGTTLIGTYDTVNHYYYLLLGTSRGLIYRTRDGLDEYRDLAISYYQEDYAKCLGVYETMKGIALGTLSGFDESLYDSVRVSVANIETTVGYTARISRTLDNGDSYVLECNLTMDKIEDMDGYAITDCSYRVLETRAETGLQYHYIKEFRFQNAKYQSTYNWSRDGYTLSFADASTEGITPEDFFLGVE